VFWLVPQSDIKFTFLTPPVLWVSPWAYELAHRPESWAAGLRVGRIYDEQNNFYFVMSKIKHFYFFTIIDIHFLLK